VRRFLVHIAAHWRKIGLYLLIAVMLVVVYRYRVLPAPADVLLDCFLYLSVATTFTPLPALPPIVHAATQAPVFLVAAVAAAGTAVAYLLEYSMLGRIMAHKRFERVQRTPLFLRLAAAFDRLPFVALIVAAFLPLPVDGVRLMAIARRYDRRRYALAAFLGRLPRYALMAGLGYGLRGILPSLAPGAGLLVPAVMAAES
jgi:membrane protein YqaA with SNARE-associated domain